MIIPSPQVSDKAGSTDCSLYNDILNCSQLCKYDLKVPKYLTMLGSLTALWSNRQRLATRHGLERQPLFDFCGRGLLYIEGSSWDLNIFQSKGLVDALIKDILCLNQPCG